MDALDEEVGEGRVHCALALEPGQAGEAPRDDLHREVALAAPVVAGVAAVAVAVVADEEVAWVQSGAKALVDFRGDGSG